MFCVLAARLLGTATLTVVGCCPSLLLLAIRASLLLVCACLAFFPGPVSAALVAAALFLSFVLRGSTFAAASSLTG